MRWYFDYTIKSIGKFVKFNKNLFTNIRNYVNILEVITMDDNQINEQWNYFKELLLSTKRPNIENLIAWLETTDFKEAPASTVYHNSFRGGLLAHSINVYHAMHDFDMWLKFYELPEDSIIIASLLHDLCKIYCYETYMKNVKNEFSKAIHPNLVTTVRMNGKVVPYAHVQRTVAFLVIFTLILVASTTIITMFDIKVFDSFFMSLSALCNVGYGSEIGDSGTLVSLPITVKWLLSFDMLIGRLELFTVLILFTKGFWIKN